MSHVDDNVGEGEHIPVAVRGQKQRNRRMRECRVAQLWEKPL
jgi:hypothetical protein